jgi:hypothetical protein
MMIFHAGDGTPAIRPCLPKPCTVDLSVKLASQTLTLLPKCAEFEKVAKWLTCSILGINR